MSSPIQAVEPPSGFSLHTKQFPSKDGATQDVVVLIPAPVSEQLQREADERAQQALEERRRLEEERDQRLRLARAKAEEEAKAAAADASWAKPLAAPLAPPGRTPPIAGLRPPSKPTIPDACPVQPVHTVPVYDWRAATQRFRDLETNPTSGDKDVVKRDLQHFAKAMASGPWRSVSVLRDWKKRLPALAAEMPNFAPVITFIAQRLALADLSGVPLQPPPILLLGSPGVGKTHFTERLAAAMRTVVYRQAFDNAQSNAALRGAERYWGNTATGALWEFIVLGTHANPVILLDELDKAGEGGGRYRPADALLTLLEPVTASRVKDVSVDFEFDASHAWFIATANDARQIGPPLRSRFAEFVIQPPDIDGRLTLAHGVFQATLERLVPSKRKRARFKPPTNLQICRLAWLTPREIRMASERLLGAAALAGRWHLEDADLDEALAKAVAPTRRRKRGDDGPDAMAIVLVRSPS